MTITATTTATIIAKTFPCLPSQVLVEFTNFSAYVSCSSLSFFFAISHPLRKQRNTISAFPTLLYTLLLEKVCKRIIRVVIILSLSHILGHLRLLASLDHFSDGERSEE